MAFCMKLKLPKFKVNQRIGAGIATRRDLPRGRKETTFTEESQGGSSISDHDHAGDIPHNESQLQQAPIVEGADASLHTIKQKAVTAGWDDVRSSLLKAAVESSALPTSQCCIKCPNPATHRCIQCGALAYYCRTCFEEAHSVTNLFHVGEVWEDDVFKPIELTGQRIDVRLPHDCSSTFSFPLCCLDEKGCEHNINFVGCQCEPVVVTMVRAQLWPAAPKRPQIAFTFELMDWVEALLLECQVSLKDFCKALCFKCPHLVNKRKGYYSAMIDSAEEYRCMKVELRNLAFVSDLDCGNVCPSCPKESGTVVFSMDALFGLPRKKSAGKSFREAIHGHYFFKQQHEVDEYVSTAPTKKRKDLKMCSDFHAGDALRSSHRYHALDETALFGTACRHEFPHLFINLKHGERLGYGVWLLTEIVEQQPKSVKIYLMYDIACTLVRHLKGNGNTELLERVSFSIPAFHSYCHVPACQVVYSPQRCEGLGLSDGEVMERLWSYLRRFSRMTKEMRPAHRTEVLTHALLYYAFTTKQRLARLLVQRFNKARGLRDVAMQTYTQLATLSPEPITDELVAEWTADEKTIISAPGQRACIPEEWKLNYYIMLQAFYTSRATLMSGTSNDLVSVRNEVFAMESKLAEFEIRNNISERWKPSDSEFIHARQIYLSEKQALLSSTLRTIVVKRQFLLKLMSKYADGQKIAQRLSKGISKETNKAKQLLQDYNSVSSAISPTFTLVSLMDILSPDTDMWQSTQNTASTVPLNLRKDIADAYFLKERCKEELEILTDDMQNALAYWDLQKSLIKQSMEMHRANLSLHSKGAVSLLHRKLCEIELMHSRARASFNIACTLATIKDCDSSSADETSESEPDTDSDANDD